MAPGTSSTRERRPQGCQPVWRTDEQLLGFAADARFDVVDFHPVDTHRGYRLQSLTLHRPAR
jgi:hypothetical protein